MADEFSGAESAGHCSPPRGFSAQEAVLSEKGGPCFTLVKRTILAALKAYLRAGARKRVWSEQLNNVRYLPFPAPSGEYV
jgi:hypothetical protein